MSEVAVKDSGNLLPENWVFPQIQEICEVNPRVDKKLIPEDLEVSFVPMPAVEPESGVIDVSEEKLFSEVKKGFTPFQEDDVLFAKITPCMENGKMALVPKVTNDYGFGSTEFHVLRASNAIDAKYLYYFVSSRTFRGHAQHNMSGAVGQKRVPTNYLKEHRIPLAPPEQQKRIVAKVEELFSHIDAGIAALNKAKQLLKQYRQSVLKAAVTGELLGNVFPADIFRPIDFGLDSLSQGWSPRCEKEPSTDESTWGVIKTTAVQSLEYRQEENKRLPDTLDPRPKHEILEGDLLVTRAGPRVRVGICCLVKKTREKIMICDKVYRLRVNSGVILPEYLELILNAPNVLSEIEKLKSGINDSGVNLTQKNFVQLTVPYPSIPDQQKSISIVSEKVESISRLSIEIEKQLVKAEKNKQSILSAAFSGEIVV